MRCRDQDLNRLKRMSPTALKREGMKAWITLHMFFDGQVDETKAGAALKTIGCINRLRNQDVRDLRLELRTATLIKRLTNE